jgi:hypothetical protein
MRDTVAMMGSATVRACNSNNTAAAAAAAAAEHTQWLLAN